eukprot:606397-Rhodomonas_salina.2
MLIPHPIVLQGNRFNLTIPASSSPLASRCCLRLSKCPRNTHYATSSGVKRQQDCAQSSCCTDSSLLASLSSSSASALRLHHPAASATRFMASCWGRS